jgi:hypothetical protein
MHVDEAWGYDQAYGINDRGRLGGRQEAHFSNAAIRYGHFGLKSRFSRAIDDQPVSDQNIEHLTPPISSHSPNVVCLEAERTDAP